MARKNSQARIAQQVSESGREIWLAGLGAFATARQEGNKLFDLLVKEGKGLETRTRAAPWARWSMRSSSAWRRR
jgi:poly(hydroxyalkanoate) granule-associated protein